MALFKKKAKVEAESPDIIETTEHEQLGGRRPICLALQGGGAHEAFQWGVLDRLLEADLLDIRALPRLLPEP